MNFMLFGNIVRLGNVRCVLRSCVWWLVGACVVVCVGVLGAVVWVGVWREFWVVVCVGVARWSGGWVVLALVLCFLGCA